MLVKGHFQIVPYPYEITLPRAQKRHGTITESLEVRTQKFSKQKERNMQYWTTQQVHINLKILVQK